MSLPAGWIPYPGTSWWSCSGTSWRTGTRSILFSTHITSDLEKCASHIAFIKDGEMLYNGGVADFRERFRDKGETMEDIIVAVERRELDDSAII